MNEGVESGMHEEMTVDGNRDRMEIGRKELGDHVLAHKKESIVPETTDWESTVDGDGDTAMNGLDEHKMDDKTKGKEVEVSQQVETIEGSSTTATTGSGSASTSLTS